MRRNTQLAGVLARRLAIFVATVMGVVVVIHSLLWLAPGDAIDTLPSGEELRPMLEQEWGLDQPLTTRMTTVFGRLARGDFGTSWTYRPGLSVSTIIATPAIKSMFTLLGALVLALSWAISLAWWTSARPSRSKLLMQLLSVAPVFLLAHLAILGLNGLAHQGLQAGWWGRPSWFALPLEASGFKTLLTMMVLAVGSGVLHELHLEFETALRRLRNAPFIDAARGRGEPLGGHLISNLLPFAFEVIGRRIGFFVGGLVVLEKVMLQNGCGAILWDAAVLRDVPLAAAISLIAAIAVCCVRFGADAGRIALDPRLRHAERADA